MKNVVIRAPLLSVSGYGEHSRQIYKYLCSKKNINLKTQVVQWGNTSWSLDKNAYDGLVGKIMSESAAAEQKYDVSFQVQLPDEWSDSLATFNIGVTAGVETTICNTKWIDSINKMNLVIVPSNHVKTTFEKSGTITTPIVVIGEWYQEELDKEPLQNVLNLEFETKNNFLVVSQLTALDDTSDRKNILNTIKWFCETFSNNKDVGLILKTNLGRGTHLDRAGVHNVITQALTRFRKGQYPKVHVVHGNMSDHEIASLYKHKSIIGFINITRGEGFGIPILDASIAELPVVTTGWSGHLDFMNLGRYISIDCDLIDIPESKVDERIFVKGAKWANPREADFKKKLLKLYENNKIPKEWAKELSAKCKNKYSKAAIIDAYDKILTKIIDQQ